MIKPVHNDKSYRIRTVRTRSGKKYNVTRHGASLGVFSRVQGAKAYAISHAERKK